MAPVAVAPANSVVWPEVVIKANASAYKEQAPGPNTYSKELEETGTVDQPKASVCSK